MTGICLFPLLEPQFRPAVRHPVLPPRSLRRVGLVKNAPTGLPALKSAIIWRIRVMILSFGQPFFFREYMFWKQHAPLTNSYITDRLCELRNHFGELNLFRMDGSDVQPFLESGASDDPRRMRADVYLRLFRDAAQLYPSARPLIFGACLGDTGFPEQEFPIFSFQKLRQSMNFLFPDIDALTSNFYN